MTATPVEALSSVLKEIGRADEGLADRYARVLDDSLRNDLACERIGLQRAAELVRSAINARLTEALRRAVGE